LDKDEKDKKTGKYIRKERYAGSMSRSFYVGEGITQDEISAKYENGILQLKIPKKTDKAVAGKNYIRHNVLYECTYRSFYLFHLCPNLLLPKW